MTESHDTSLRSLERAAAQGDPQATEALAVARLRSGEAQPGLVVRAWHLTPSDCVQDHEAVDVDLDVTVDGLACEESCEVTLAWDRPNARWAAYGDCVDSWVSPDLLAWLRARADGDRLRDWLYAIEAEAARYASLEVTS